jgi:hypothetical protein
LCIEKTSRKLLTYQRGSNVATNTILYFYFYCQYMILEYFVLYWITDTLKIHVFHEPNTWCISCDTPCIVLYEGEIHKFRIPCIVLDNRYIKNTGIPI